MYEKGKFYGQFAWCFGWADLAFSSFEIAANVPPKAIFYNISNSSFDAIRGKHDALNAMAAAGLSGAIYKSTGTSLPIPVYALLGAQLIFL